MKLFYLSILALFVTSSFVISTTEIPKQINEKILGVASSTNAYESKSPVLLPVLNSDKFPVLSSQGAIAVDLDSAVILYEKNPDTPLLPASTTKILTAIVAMDYYDLQTVLEVNSINVIGQKMKLVEGERMSVFNLIKGLLIYSANDAAEVLASNYPGGRVEFIKKMNEKAAQLQMNNSHFKNPTGLDQEGHVSTARDMVRLSEVALRNQTFQEIVATKEVIVKSVDEKFSHNLKNINELLGVVPGVMGVKTGWTEEARENLVSYVNRDGKKVLIAILGSQDRFGETRELIDWVYNNFTWKEVTYHSSQK